MRLFVIFIFVICYSSAFSQKVTLTPISFNKDFTLEKAPTKSVLKDYTQFSQSPFKKVPKGFISSNASVFYKFDTLNCSLFIKNRKDIDGIYYYRDCEDAFWCLLETRSHFNEDTRKFDEEYSKIPNIMGRRTNFMKHKGNCCDLNINSDTSALIKNNEFISFQDFLAIDQNVPFSSISENYVTNKEYHEFVNYVVDSIMRTQLATHQPSIYYLDYNEKLDWENRLNYSVKYSPADRKLMSSLSQCYYPDHEKYSWKKQLDTRKINCYYLTLPPFINYSLNICINCQNNILNDPCKQAIKKCGMEGQHFSYSELLNFQSMDRHFIVGMEDKVKKGIIYNTRYRTNIIIYPDTLSWLWVDKSNTTLNYSIWASQNYFQKKEFENLPVQGINYWQAKAFLAWKTKFHNQQLIREKSNYRVLYTFPLPEEITDKVPVTIRTSKIDFDKYVISNKEYEEFVVAVADSIVVRMMSNFDPEKYLYPPYDDNYDERPISDWKLDKSWLKKYYQMPIKRLKNLNEYIHFETLIIKVDSVGIKYEGFDNRTFYYAFMWQYYDKDSLFQQRDLRLSSDEYHVYGVEDRSRYIIRDKIQIFPGYDKIGYSRFESEQSWKKIDHCLKKCDSLGIGRNICDSLDSNHPLFWQLNPRYFEKEDYTMPFKTYDFKKSPNEPITAITYEQAKAYYHWKNEVPYIPTKEEWQQIQKGINPYEVKELEVPGPFFRYAIRVYPVRNE